MVEPTLEINVEHVCYIITKARQFDAEFEEDDLQEGSNPGDDDEAEALVSSGEDSSLAELKGAIHELTEDDQITLIALLWLGRGDFDIAEWPQACALADERHRGDSVDYLLGTPLFADYLEEGLAAFDLSCVDAGGGRA